MHVEAATGDSTSCSATTSASSSSMTRQCAGTKAPVDTDAAVNVVGRDASRVMRRGSLRRAGEAAQSSATATMSAIANTSIAQLSGRGSAMTSRARSMKSA